MKRCVRACIHVCVDGMVRVLLSTVHAYFNGSTVLMTFSSNTLLSVSMFCVQGTSPVWKKLAKED